MTMIMSRFRRLCLLLAWLFYPANCLVASSFDSSSSSSSSSVIVSDTKRPLLSSTSTTYRYFAYGSNMDPSTMESLRRIQPLSAQAGILLDYKLVFDIPGMPLVEPSAASVRKLEGSIVHGVVYELTDADFAIVGNTEGVPFAYQWQACQVIPYIGDNQRAGQDVLEKKGGLDDDASLSCYTLVAGKRGGRDNDTKQLDHIPPSPSYLKILQDGAAYWKMDRSYQTRLGKIRVADNLLVKDGLSGSLLFLAKLMNPPK